MIKKLAGQIKQYKKETILTPVFASLEVVMETLMPIVMAKIIDNGIEAGNMSYVYKCGGVMVLMAFLSLAFGVVAGRLAATASTGFSYNLRQSMYENIQTFSFSNIDKFSTAGLVTRMTTDVTNVQNAFQMIIRMCVRAPMTLLCSLVMAVIICPKLSLLFVVAAIFLFGVLMTITKMVMPLFQAVFEKYDALNASVQENVSAIRVVKSFVREEYENEKFAKAADNIYKMFVKAESILAFNAPTMMLASYGCILALSWFGAKMITFGTLTTGELTSMFSYVMQILMSLMMLSFLFVSFVMARASINRICEVLDEEPDIVNPETPETEVKDGSIVFDHVGFSYSGDEGNLVLEDANFTIHSGETIGILGGTGSSKTTLVSLIPRLYDTTEGSVKVSGRDVREYDLTALRDAVAVVLQKNLLFSGTIRENLRWGNEHATDAELEEACRLAQADDFIRSFPDGYDTKIEQGGTNVSGGQKQRLCIARALLKKPKILILDDSTSAVDMKTDAFIRAGFKSFIPETTKIIIAQRVASVQDADLILVMDNGMISAMGKHDELLKTSEIYREVYEQQTGGKEDGNE